MIIVLWPPTILNEANYTNPNQYFSSDTVTVVVRETGTAVLVASFWTDGGATPTGFYPSTYQWLLNDAPIPGATAATLVINGVSMADGGVYRVLTKSGNTSVLSNSAVLTVNPLVVPSSGSFDPPVATVGPSGGEGTVSLTVAPGNATWTVSSDSDWLSIPSGISGTGSWTLMFSAAPNPLPTIRTAQISVAGAQFTVSQDAGGIGVQTNATLIHQYKFSGNANDSVGSANGTLMNGATATGGRLSLNGVNQYVEFGSHIVPTSGSYSVVLFVRETTSVSDYVEFISQGFSGGPGLYIDHTPSPQTIRVSDSWMTTGVPFPGDGQWHCYALVVDSVASQSRLFVDGIQKATMAAAIATTPAGTNTRFGRQYDPGPSYLRGNLADVQIYTGALSSAEVAQIAAAAPIFSVPGGPGNPQISFTHVPPYGSGSGSTLEGQTSNVDSSSNAVACYIDVNGWWIKPYFDAPLTPIRNDGSWSCLIVTGGYDSLATAVAAFLIPKGYSPPLLAGASTLPPDLFQASIANAQTQRPLVSAASMLAVAPLSIVFNYTPHGGTPSPYYISVTSTPSGAVFTTSLASPCAWLDFIAGSGVTPVVDIYAALNTLAADGLSPGAYNCTIMVTTPSASAGGLINETVPVTLTVTAGASSSISVYPASWTFIYPQPQVPPTGTPPFTVRSSPGSLITPSLGSGCNWLNPTMTPNWNSPVSLGPSVNSAVAATLKPDSYPCSITFTAAGTSASATLVLTLVVPPRATVSTLAVDPSSMTFNYTQRGGMPPAYFMSVTSSPIGVAFTTSLGPGCSWLDFTPSNGVTPAMGIHTALNTVAADGMSPGAYNCTITVTARSTSGSLITMTVPVKLVVTASSVSVNPSSWTFNYPLTVPSTGTPPFGVSSSPPSMITPSDGSSCSWLSLTSANWNSPVSLSLGVNTAVAATLKPGSYPCTVTFTAAGISANATLSLTLVVR